MSTQHLSDEAVAAFADGVLRGHARERAGRHTARCPECAHAVTVQREAVLALRAAPPPPLPTALLDRLRSVPVTTPLTATPFPTVITQDGETMFAAFGSRLAPMAALVEPRATRPRAKLRPVAVTAAAVAAAGVLAVGSAGHAAGSSSFQPNQAPANVHVAPVYLSGP